MDVSGLIIYTLLVIVVLLIILLLRQQAMLQENNNSSNQNSETNKDSEEKIKELEDKIKQLESEKSQLEEQNAELKERADHITNMLSEEQKARFEAEEKAKEAAEMRDYTKETTKRTIEALEVESQMAVIVAQEKAKKQAQKLQKEAEEREKKLQQEAEEREKKLQQESEENARKLKEAEERERQTQKEAEEREKQLQEEAEEREKKMQEEAELRERKLQEEAERKLEEEKAKWSTAVTTTSKKIADLSFGKIRAVNNLDLDQLINVHGKHRPLAVFVKPRSSNLSHSGAFIYDTHKLKDNSLYLFIGKDCPPALEQLTEKLLDAYKQEYPTTNLIRIIRTTEGPDFNRMIKVIGGHIDQIQPSSKAGDELFFENNFFAVKLHLIIYSHGEIQTPDLKTISLDDLPEEGAAVIDTSDTALYLYIPHSDPINDVEKADQEKCIKWMSEEREYNGRDVTIFNKTCVPPNLKVLFNIV